jgi:peptidoglycan/LPS O-acetylase OafA/YrhL
MPMADQNDGPRWRELDAIRGIAACIVVFWHFYQLLTPATLPVLLRLGMEGTPLYIIISGSESVMLFFLLSGFVLSLPFHRSPNRLNYRSFLVKRIARIYLPYFAALFLAVVGNAWCHGLAINSWFMETWYDPPKLTTILQHVLFIGNYNYYAFNTAFWSLVYEMRISIIFPFLCVFVIRIGWSRSILLAAAFGLSSMILRIGGIPGQTTETFKYLSFFVVGILLAQHALPIRESLSRRPKILRVTGILLSLLLYSLAHLFPGALKDSLLLIGASGIIVAKLADISILRPDVL